MVDIARQPILTSRMPLRSVGLGLLLIALLLAALVAVVVGTRPKLPAPFGPAHNGLVAYAMDGDIYTADPVTGVPKAVVIGPETDLRPLWSLDGAHMAFERKVKGAAGPGQVYVAKPDGTELTLMTPEPLSAIASYAFSPNGHEILISTELGIASTMLIATTDGKATRTLAVGGMIPTNPEYRPPAGDEIVFVGQVPDAVAQGLYAVRSDGSGLRTIVEPTNLLMLGPKSSPDGTTIAFSAIRADYETIPSSLLRVYTVPATGPTPRILRDLASPDDLETVAAWSNDGTRLLISGCYRSEGGVADCPSTLEVVPVAGSGPIVRIDVAAGFPGADGTSHAWAPDDTAIITTPLSGQGAPMGEALSWDPITGRSLTVPWSGGGPSSWQRVH